MSLDKKSLDVKETRSMKTTDAAANSKPYVISKTKALSISSDTSLNSKMGSRRIFTPHFKLQVLESYRNDGDCKGNQRATARKYNIHRRQIQKWLQCETNLRSSISNAGHNCTLRHEYHNVSHSSKNQDHNLSITLGSNLAPCEDDLQDPRQFQSEFIVQQNLVTLNSSEALSRKLFSRKLAASKTKSAFCSKDFSALTTDQTAKEDNNSLAPNVDMKFSKHIACASIPQKNIFLEPTYQIDHRHLYHYKIPYMHANTSAGIPQTLPISTQCDQTPLQLFPHFQFHERLLPHAHAHAHPHPHLHTLNMMHHANTSTLSYMPTPSLPMASFPHVVPTTKASSSPSTMFFDMEKIDLGNISNSLKSADSDKLKKTASSISTSALQNINAFYTFDKRFDSFEDSNKDLQTSPTGPIDLSAGTREIANKTTCTTTGKRVQCQTNDNDRSADLKKEFFRHSSERTVSKVEDSVEENKQSFKRIKLFKPYLLDNQEQTSASVENNKKTIYDHSTTNANGHDNLRGKSEPCSSSFLENNDPTRNWIEPSHNAVASKNSNTSLPSFESSTHQSTSELIRSPPKGSPVSGYESSTSTFSDFSLRKEVLRDDDVAAYTDAYSLEVKLQSINKHYLNFNENSVQNWLEREVATMTPTDTSVTLYA